MRRILVQGDHRQVVGLIGHAPVEPAILDHDIRGDMALPLTSFQVSLAADPQTWQVCCGGYCSLSQAVQCCRTSRLVVDRIPKRFAQFIGTGISFGIASLRVPPDPAVLPRDPPCWPLQSEVLAQRATFVLAAEEAAALQLGHHEAGEALEASRDHRRSDHEAVAALARTRPP